MVANLATSVSASELENMFSMVGNVRSTRIVYHADTGVSKGMGYVEMSTREEMENCVLYFAGQTIDGQAIMVRENVPHVPKPRSKVRLLKS
jgi:RNA recognition motif-containing protein